MMQKIDEARKAVAALLVPALFVLAGALLDESHMGSTVSTFEWLQALIAALGTSGAVYAIKNADSDDPTTSTPGPHAGGIH